MPFAWRAPTRLVARSPSGRIWIGLSSIDLKLDSVRALSHTLYAEVTMSWSVRSSGKAEEVRTAVGTAAAHENLTHLTGKEGEIKDKAIELINHVLDAQSTGAKVSVDASGAVHTQVGAEQHSVSIVITPA
jgi:hypothetical protein